MTANIEQVIAIGDLGPQKNRRSPKAGFTGHATAATI